MFIKKKYVFVICICVFCIISFFLCVICEHYGSFEWNKGFYTDMEVINKLAHKAGCYIYIIDKNVVSIVDSSEQTPIKSPIILGIDEKFAKKLLSNEAFQILKRYNSDLVLFYNEKPLMKNFGFQQNELIAIVLQQNYIYIIYVLYLREDNTWWYGNLASDGYCCIKLQKFLLPHEICNSSLHYENIVDRLYFTPFNRFQHSYSNIFLPKDTKSFTTQSASFNFIECNYSRAEIFKNKFKSTYGDHALRFRHRAWKILSKTKTILDLLSVPFWISSGTCLGFFRECDIIAHSLDVDIGIYAHDYNESIILSMEEHGLKLIHWFGQPNDSFELSFIDKGGVKLDIFFFYEERNYIWNGGTQLRTGKKFKYIFPKITLCWTLFCGLKVRIPCETESYIVANYGNNWFTPIYHWDWKSNPHNVITNGIWSATFRKSYLLK